MIERRIIKTDFSEYTNKDFIERINITKNQYEQLLKRYLVLMKDGYYYEKKLEKEALCNEIIGRYICNKVNLETTKIEILKEEGSLYDVVTPNYRKSSFSYIEEEDKFEFGLKVSLFNDEYFDFLSNALKKDILKLTALDLMMEQTDRYARNMELSISKSGSIRLAPVIDFEFAFETLDPYKYTNPYLAIEKTEEALFSFCNKYPSFFPYLDKTFSIVAEELFSYLASDYDLKTEWPYHHFVVKTIEKNQKILKRIR